MRKSESEEDDDEENESCSDARFRTNNTSRLLIWMKKEGKSSLTSWFLVVLPFLK